MVTVSDLFDVVERFKATDANRLKAEYQRLVEGLAQRGDLRGIFHVVN